MTDPLSRLRDEARDEAYEYFDKHVRKLTRLPNGKISPTARGLEDNDADAFRHAYVSGVFTQEYGEAVANLLGLLTEISPEAAYSNSNNPRAKNMDLWNNSAGRAYGKKAKSRKELLKLIHQALKKGELISEEFVAQIESGKYSGYAVKDIGGVPTPVSKPDGRRTNNLAYPLAA
jgi:hypothetical protein